MLPGNEGTQRGGRIINKFQRPAFEPGFGRQLADRRPPLLRREFLAVAGDAPATASTPAAHAAGYNGGVAWGLVAGRQASREDIRGQREGCG